MAPTTGLAGSCPSSLPRLIIALDLDAFYVSASRKRDPSLIGKPVGIKQKALVATISYEARAVGVKKLDSVKEALKRCPDLILVNGEDLSYFRMLSSAICNLVQGLVWKGKVEKLGMDELYCDVTDMVDEHLREGDEGGESSMSPSRVFDLRPSSSRIAPVDPQDLLSSFIYDPRTTPGHAMPLTDDALTDDLSLRLRTAAHLASHLRQLIQDRIGLTASAGIAETKLMSKLVGSLNKPAQQTVFMPPPSHPGKGAGREAFTHDFLAPLDLRSVPGFGLSILETMRSRMAQRELRAPAANGIPWRNVEAVDPKEKLTVAMARLYWTPDSLSDLFGERLGTRLWALLWGADEEPVIPAPEFPQQISIEDTFPRAIHGAETQRQLELLSYSLIRRLETELLSSPSSASAATPSRSSLGSTTMVSQALDFRPLDTPVDRELRPNGVEGLVRTYKELDILDWVKDAQGSLQGLEWRRYPTSLRLAIRLGWGNRTSRQGRMPVEVFELSLPRRERAKIMSRALQVHLKAMLGTSYGREELNLINIAAIDLSDKRPDRAIGSYFAAGKAQGGGAKKRPREGEGEQGGFSTRRADRHGLDPAVLAELPEELRLELLRGHGDAPAALPDRRDGRDEVMTCSVCGRGMETWLQHDHDEWPETGLPSQSCKQLDKPNAEEEESAPRRSSLEEAALEDAACVKCGVPLARLDLLEHARWHKAQDGAKA